jgi:hypothetical protein
MVGLSMAKLRVDMHNMGFDFCCATCDAPDIPDSEQCHWCIEAHTEMRAYMLSHDDQLSKLMQSVYFSGSMADKVFPDSPEFKAVAEFKESLSRPVQPRTPDEVYGGWRWQRRRKDGLVGKRWGPEVIPERVDIDAEFSKIPPAPKRDMRSRRSVLYDPSLQQIPQLSDQQQQRLRKEIKRLKRLQQQHGRY